MTRGVLMYAHNNSEIDYFKIACANALMIKKNLKVPVTLVTDQGTLQWSTQTLGEDFINSCFDNVIEVQRDYTFSNARNFQDTCWNTKSLQFYNTNHWQAYDLSPYDETLFIDADYLIMSSALDNCWGSINDVMINRSIFTPGEATYPHSMLVDNMGITLYWATVIYFRKSLIAQHLFSIVREVQENYQYYKDLFFFANDMFRNDNAFSIAVHMLNGFGSMHPAIQELPITGLLMSWDTNDIHSINGTNDITVYAEKPGQQGLYTLARIKDTDIHIMNKWSISRHADKLIALYKETA